MLQSPARSPATTSARLSTRATDWGVRSSLRERSQRLSEGGDVGVAVVGVVRQRLVEDGRQGLGDVAAAGPDRHPRFGHDLYEVLPRVGAEVEYVLAGQE